MTTQLDLLTPTLDDSAARRLGLHRTREVKRPRMQQAVASLARPGISPPKTFATVDVPRAATADPETSHIAAARIRDSGALGKQQRIVLDAVNRWPNSTSAELAYAIAKARGEDYATWRQRTGRRLPELACDVIHVKRSAARVCAKTGAMCITWRPA